MYNNPPRGQNQGGLDQFANWTTGGLTNSNILARLGLSPLKMSYKLNNIIINSRLRSIPRRGIELDYIKHI